MTKKQIIGWISAFFIFLVVGTCTLVVFVPTESETPTTSIKVTQKQSLPEANASECYRVVLAINKLSDKGMTTDEIFLGMVVHYDATAKEIQQFASDCHEVLYD